MRLIMCLGLFAVMGLAVGTADDKKDEKIDAKKLIGKWATKEGAAEKFVVEFTKDGKLNFMGGDKKIEGTYKLDGNKLTIKATVDGKDETMVRTITKLTETELTSKDEKKDTEDTLVRVKAKDKK